MAIKVIDAVGSDDATYSEIDLFSGKKLSEDAKAQAQEQVGQYLIEQTLLALSKAKTPVQGAPYKPTLSKEYKKIKVSEGLSDKPDMENSGSMLNALEWKPTEKGIMIGIFDPEQAGKADGHNQFSGRDTPLPVRQWLPDVGQKYANGLMEEAEKIVAEAFVDNTQVNKQDFQGVETKSQLYNVLKDIFDGLVGSEIRAAVLLNEDVLAILEDLDLLDLL